METLKEDLIKKLGEDNFKKIQNTKIGLAGAGGLGSNCALNLVRTGFKRFIIVDYDVVSHANLDRQFYFLDQVGKNKVDALKDNLNRINPEIEIKAVIKKIEASNVKELFNDCDIIIECLDIPEYKSMFVSESLKLNKLVIAVSGLGGLGNSDEIRINKINKNLIIVGDLKSDVSQKPALSPRVNIAGAKQADIVLEYVLTSNL